MVASFFGIFGQGALHAIADEAKPTDAAASEVSYYRDIRPILQEHCQGCHQPAKRGGEYVMTSFKDLLKGGESEAPAVVPGDLEESYLVLLITPDDEGHAEMPKDKPALAKGDIAKITQWIKAGAKDDTPESARQKFDAAHPPVYQSPPVITSLDFSPDGSLLAVSGYHEVLLHKVAGSGAHGSELVGRLVGLSERIQSLKFSPDGKRLAVAGGSPARMGEIQIWDVEKKTLLLSVPSTFDTLYGASWSHDGAKVAFGCGDNTVRAIDVTTGAQVLYQGAHNDWVLDTVFSTDSSHLVSVSRDRSMKLIEVATQRFVDNITSITPGALKGGLGAVDRHPTKDELIVGGADGMPKLFRMYRPADKARQIGDDFNKIRDFAPLPGRIYAAEFNHDGSQIVVGSSNDGTGEIRIYKTDDAQLIAKYDGQPGGIYSATFNHDSSVIAAGGFEGNVLLINAADGKLLKEFVPVPIESGSATGGSVVSGQ
jgi:mono/diheme cytochrome c family protein/DNA-binding beta-propeller fold protein YncE